MPSYDRPLSGKSAGMVDLPFSDQKKPSNKKTKEMMRILKIEDEVKIIGHKSCPFHPSGLSLSIKPYLTIKEEMVLWIDRDLLL